MTLQSFPPQINRGLGRLGVAGRVAAGGFDPTQIAGLRLWLDFSDIATLFQDAARTVPVAADGDVIGGVTDKSGQARHAVQSNGGLVPTYATSNFSAGAARNVGGKFLVHPTFSLSSFTLFFVMKFAALSNYSRWINSSGNSDYIRHGIAGSVEIQTGLAGAQEIPKAISSNSSYIMSVAYNFNLYLYLNSGNNLAGAATETGDMTFLNFFGDFQNQPLDIAEYLVYSDLLSDENRVLVRDYLNAKWAIY
jgi:hypothetical protein